MPRILMPGLMIGATILLSCEGDSTRPGCDPCPPAKTFQSLSEREHVLNNLELSYNQRNIAQFDKLLDVNFTFFFAPGDVGGSIPPQWGRADEASATAGLFCRTGCDPSLPLCRSIRVDVKFENGVAWDDTVPPAFPTETWYMTTVYYEFTIEIEPDQTYIAVSGSRALFTVRNTGTDDAPQWRLVQWRDLGDNSAALRSVASTSATTWGGVKSLYR